MVYAKITETVSLFYAYFIANNIAYTFEYSCSSHINIGTAGVLLFLIDNMRIQRFVAAMDIRFLKYPI